MQITKHIRNWLDQVLFDEEALFLLVVLGIALLVILFFGATLAPVFAALILSFLLHGAVSACMRIRASRLWAVHIVFFFFIGSLLALLFFFIPLAGRQFRALLEQLPAVVGRVRSVMNDLPTMYPAVISEDQIQIWLDYIATRLQEVSQWVLTSSIDVLPNLFTVMIYLILVPILVYFMLRDSADLLSFAQSLLPKKRNLILRVGREMSRQFANYLRGKAIEILLVGSVTYVCFLALNLNYALVLAALVGFSVLVPFIGAAVVTVPIAFVGLLQWGLSSETAWLLIVYGIIQLLDGNVLVPLLFSEAVNLHPVTIIVAVLVFGGLWGIWGVFFAIPLATLVKAVYMSWPVAPPQESV